MCCLISVVCWLVRVGVRVRCCWFGMRLSVVWLCLVMGIMLLFMNLFISWIRLVVWLMVCWCY